MSFLHISLWIVVSVTLVALPATRHKWTRPALTPARQAGTRFTYPEGMEGWVDLRSLIAARPGIEPTTAWLQVRRPNRYATKTPVKTPGVCVLLAGDGNVLRPQGTRLHFHAPRTEVAWWHHARITQERERGEEKATSCECCWNVCRGMINFTELSALLSLYQVWQHFCQKLRPPTFIFHKYTV